jgi:hypothetical protein
VHSLSKRTSDIGKHHQWAFQGIDARGRPCPRLPRRARGRGVAPCIGQSADWPPGASDGVTHEPRREHNVSSAVLSQSQHKLHGTLARVPRTSRTPSARRSHRYHNEQVRLPGVEQRWRHERPMRDWRSVGNGDWRIHASEVLMQGLQGNLQRKRDSPRVMLRVVRQPMLLAVPELEDPVWCDQLVDRLNVGLARRSGQDDIVQTALPRDPDGVRRNGDTEQVPGGALPGRQRHRLRCRRRRDRAARRAGSLPARQVYARRKRGHVRSQPCGLDDEAFRATVPNCCCQVGTSERSPQCLAWQGTTVQHVQPADSRSSFSHP